MDTRRVLLAVGSVLFGMLACNLPAGLSASTITPAPTAEANLPATITSQASTIEASNRTATPGAEPAATPLAATSSVPEVSVSATTNCRSGPSKAHDLLLELDPGTPPRSPRSPYRPPRPPSPPRRPTSCTRVSRVLSWECPPPCRASSRFTWRCRGRTWQITKTVTESIVPGISSRPSHPTRLRISTIGSETSGGPWSSTLFGPSTRSGSPTPLNNTSAAGDIHCACTATLDRPRSASRSPASDSEKSISSKDPRLRTARVSLFMIVGNDLGSRCLLPTSSGT
jgi:hypothetical protein